MNVPGTLDAFGDDPTSGGGPATRGLAQGLDWCISEHVCTAGPADRPFEERREWATVAAVIEGSFNYRNDTGRVVLHRGALLFGNPDTCYECGHDHGTGDRCIALQLSPAYFAEVAASIAGSSGFRFPTSMLPVMPDVVPWLARMEAWASISERIEIEGMVPRLLETVIRAVSGASPNHVRVSARDERRVIDTLRYIEANATEDLNLDTLAGQAAMSKYHFLRVFRRTVEMTPYQFLLGVRMRRAAVRLATSSERVSTIAFDSGFGDLSTFNCRFREIFGLNPSAWRDRERTWRAPPIRQ